MNNDNIISANTLMDEIRAVSFALTDLKLYLDTHPEECQKITIYNSFVEKHKYLVDEFQMNYGPIAAETVVSDCPWEWINDPWPWDLSQCTCYNKRKMEV